MKIQYNGLTASDRFLSVHVTVSEEAWMKFGVVRVPLSELLQETVTDAMDRTVRRRLIQVWSEQDLADPLF